MFIVDFKCVNDLTTGSILKTSNHFVKPFCFLDLRNRETLSLKISKTFATCTSLSLSLLFTRQGLNVSREILSLDQETGYKTVWFPKKKEMEYIMKGEGRCRE